MPWLGPFLPLTMKRRSVSGNELNACVELVGIGFQVIEIGVLRRLGQREQHPLILLGREFGASYACT